MIIKIEIILVLMSSFFGYLEETFARALYYKIIFDEFCALEPTTSRFRKKRAVFCSFFAGSALRAGRIILPTIKLKS